MLLVSGKDTTISLIWCPLQIFSSRSLCCPAELGRRCGRRAVLPRLATPSNVYPYWVLWSAAATAHLWSVRQVWEQNDIGDFKAVVSTKRQEVKMSAHLSLWDSRGRLSWRKFGYLRQCNSSALPECLWVSLGAFLMLINHYWPSFPVKKEMKTTVLAALGLSVTAVLWLLLSCLNASCAWDSYSDVYSALEGVRAFCKLFSRVVSFPLLLFSFSCFASKNSLTVHWSSLAAELRSVGCWWATLWILALNQARNLSRNLLLLSG